MLFIAVDDKPWCKVRPIFISLWIIYVRHVQCSYQNNRNEIEDERHQKYEVERQQNKTPSLSRSKTNRRHSSVCVKHIRRSSKHSSHSSEPLQDLHLWDVVNVSEQGKLLGKAVQVCQSQQSICDFIKLLNSQTVEIFGANIQISDTEEKAANCIYRPLESQATPTWSAGTGHAHLHDWQVR